MLKKTLSVFLACIMLISVCSAGLMGVAAEIDYDVQYSSLAAALENEYVRTLTNYTITNETLENGAEGFDTDANGFAYEHRVTADDNTAGDILRAANIFYYIAEHIMSTQYGVGYYNPKLLLEQVYSKIKPYFDDGETRFEDFYGDRYYPTPEEIEKYNEAVTLIEANDAEVNEANLTRLNVYFIAKNYYEYYNVETILKYFMGNASAINTGNWYHRYVFVCETSIDTAICEAGGIETFITPELTTRTAVYEWDFVRSYNDDKTKCYYAFKKPTADRVWTNYGSEFGLPKKPSDLTESYTEDEPITVTGQASAFFISEQVDTTSVAYLSTVYNAFKTVLTIPTGSTAWDQKYINYSNTDIRNDPNNAVLVGYVKDIGQTYSNESLISMFGEQIGNIVTAAYVLTPSNETPVRTIKGATIPLTLDELDEIIYDIDGLITPRTDTNNERDEKVASKVATIVSMFFNTENSMFEGTSVYGLEYETLHDLVGMLVQGLVFRDSIVNLLVGLLYPLVADLIQENVIDAVEDAVDSTLSSLVGNLLESILEHNELAIYPESLAARLRSDYSEKCSSGGVWYNACEILEGHGTSWYVKSKDDKDYGETDYKGNTDWVNTLDWGVDAAPLSEKADAFENALCAGLGGFIRLVVTVFCGDAEYTDNVGLSYDDDQYNEYFDKKLLSVLSVYLRSQGGYTKLIVPLFRVLGLEEQTSYNGKCYGYLTPKLYHEKVAADYAMSLKLIVQPLLYWVTDVLGTHPFETLWKLLPNLVYFLSRTGYSVTSLSVIQSACNDEGAYDSTHGGISNGVPMFEQLQTYNLNTILDSIYITITVVGKPIEIGSLGSLIGKQTMLGSINGLLNELLDLEYETDVVEEEKIAGYANAEGKVVAVGSEDYELDRAKTTPEYTKDVTEYYSNADGTELVETMDDDHQERHDNVEYKTIKYKLPAIQEGKLISCATSINTEWNTLNIEHPGKVLLFVLRYVFSALGYRYDSNVTFQDVKKDENGDPVYVDNTPVMETKTLPYLIECFGLDIDMELFQGLNLKDIIYNVMLHPDDAIWSLLELFYSHEDGDYLTGEAYTYDLDKIDYHNAVLLNTAINPTLTYGTSVRYSKYWTQEYAADVVGNADEFVTNIFIMLGMTDFSEGIGKYLENLLNDSVFTNDLLNTLFNTIYQLLGGLNESLGMDLEKILDAALDVSYSTLTVADALDNMLGYKTEASEKIRSCATWTELFTVYEDDGSGNLVAVTEEDEDGNKTPVTGDVELDWGLDDTSTDDSRAEKWCKSIAALVSPVSFLIRFLFLDEDLDLLNLVKIPAYAGYQYAFIGLLEALSCPNILTYKQYAEKCNDTVNGAANSIYYLLTPILGLLEEVYAEPVDTLLSLLPNLLFVISIGGLNDIVNNLVHFAYVLLDILQPIVDGYDLLDGLLANIEVAGISLNLALPLDIDFNALASELLGSLLGDAIEISGVKITLPYIDFHTLCCGSLSAFASKELRSTVYLNAAGGGDMITALLRLVFETLFMDENEAAIAELVANAADKGEIDGYDKETIVMIVDELFGLIQEYEVLDMVLFAVYFLVNKLTPISSTLAPRFKASGMTITSLFESIDDIPTFISNISILLNVGSTVNDDGTTTDEETQTLSGFGSLIARIKAFFQKIKQFFTNMFK